MNHQISTKLILLRPLLRNKSLVSTIARRPLATTSKSTTNSNNKYESPLAPFFKQVKSGRTSSGLTANAPLVDTSNFSKLECGIDEQDLRFKAVSYERMTLPPFVQGGEFKITLKIDLADIPFENEAEKEVLLEMVGNRYDEKRQRILLNCDKFSSRIENKRYLVALLDRLVMTSRKLVKEAAGNQHA